MGWQEACSVYHRAHPCTRLRCEKSNRYLADNLGAEGYGGSQCENGLMDYAVAIVVEGKKLATLYFGQVFHTPPDLEFFRRLARESGFDEAAYLAAIQKVPVIAKERVDGIMAFYAQLAQMLARSGLDRMRLLETTDKLRRLTVQREQEREDERRRVGYEIQEDLNQCLAAMKLQLSSLLLAVDKRSDDIPQRGERMKKMLDSTLGVARNVALSMRPPVLNGGIATALEWLGREFARNTAISCRVAAHQAERWTDEERALVLYRVAEESLENILQHAEAHNVSIELSWQDAACVLEIQDDGKGFDPSIDRQGCFGIDDMRERVLALGGEVAIDSRPGQGTTVRASIPVPLQEH
jgi:signal transduction histidine kinase